MKIPKALLAILALLATFLIAGPAPAQAAPYCGITWGSLAKSAGTTSAAPSAATVDDVRAGIHPCFDRMVVDIAGHATAYSAYYTATATAVGSGLGIPLRGGAIIQITVQAPAYNSAGAPTYQPANRNELVNTSGYATFKQLAMAGSFEGSTTLVMGVRARLPFNVFVLQGPGDTTRLVVDVAHRW